MKRQLIRNPFTIREITGIEFIFVIQSSWSRFSTLKINYKPFKSRGRGRGGGDGSSRGRGGSSRGGGGRNRGHVKPHLHASASQSENGSHKSQSPQPMRFTLSNGEEIEVRQPKPTPKLNPNKRPTPPKNDKLTRTNGQPTRRGPRNKNRDNLGEVPVDHLPTSPRRNRGTPRHKETKNEETNEIDNLASSVSRLISKRNKFMINADQRVVLLDKIKKNKLECAICMEKIKHNQAIWSCKNCYNILHLKCAKEWAQSTMNKDSSSDGWRCPYCQHMDRFRGWKFDLNKNSRHLDRFFGIFDM